MESERKHIFHLSGKRFSLDDEEWTKEKSNKIVLIGKNLDHQTIKNQLHHVDLIQIRVHIRI